MHYPSIGNRDSVAREAQDNIALVSWRPASQRPIARNLQAQMSTTSDLEIIMHLPLNLLAISPKMQKTLKKIILASKTYDIYIYNMKQPHNKHFFYLYFFCLQSCSAMPHRMLK